MSHLRPLAAVLLLILSSAQAAEKPNVLIIMADDCTFNDLPLYGGQNARTPNIDALAAQGLTFNKAYLASAMCQPCRAELFTGRYPLSNGCAWNHSASRSNIESLPQILGRQGYTVGIAGKVHVKPKSTFPFRSVGGFDPSCVRDPTQPHDLSGIERFFASDDAFCLVVALVEPHVPWVMGDASQYPPAAITLPPTIADNPITREAYSRYLAEITYMDGQVGEILSALDDSGKAGETLVLFTSEQGSQFPGNKWTNWNTGVHTALVARWPGHIQAGVRTDALVQYCDVVPTLLDLCGAEPNAQLDGISFASVLTDLADGDRQFVYGMHNNLPEGPPYPIRSITDGEFHLIHNLRPDELYIEKHLMGRKGDGKLNNAYWASWTWDSQQNPATYELVKRYMSRPREQLYHTAKDPYELKNLAGDSSLVERSALLRAALDAWMSQQGDPGIAQDTMESLSAARKGNHRFTPDK
ncbi:MAG: sulfatase [Planctomycetaceae bacterium]|nr:sulfatase [Planctomycetaceae bacterium]